jgi:putative FmdB family regulatory protein
MPLYDYRCSSCGDFREFQPMKESSAARGCPICGALSERLISTPFLAGTDPGGQRTGIERYGEAGIRHACGPGCSHSHGH